MEEQVAALKLQVADLKRIILSTVKTQVKTAVQHLRVKKGLPEVSKNTATAIENGKVINKEKTASEKSIQNALEIKLQNRILRKLPHRNPKKDLEIDGDEGSPESNANHSSDKMKELGIILFKFYCPLCDKRYESAKRLFTHQGHHPEANNYKCSSCFKSFNNLYLLTLHYNKNHKNACGKVMKTLERAQVSRKSTESRKCRKMYKCEYCQQNFRHVLAFNKHVRAHEGFFSFSCPVCPEKFSTSSKLLSHSRLHEDVQDYKCRDCKETFQNLDTLIIHHHKEHNGRRKHVLAILENAFKRRRKGRAKRRTVNYQCKICLEELHTLRQFNYHLISHEKETSKDLNGYEYLCPLCGKTFEMMDSLFKHQGNHSPKSELTCLVCSKLLDNLDNLTIHHHKEHTKISENMLGILIKALKDKMNKCAVPRQIFKCERCPKRFGDYKIYADHIINHLNETDSKETFPLSFQCPACEKKSETVWKMLVHITDHSISVNSKCQKCEKNFDNVNFLTVHYYQKHFEAPEKVLEFLNNLIVNALGFGSDPDRQKFLPFSCNSCEIKCVYQKELTSHKYHAHLERKFCCELCGKQFKQQRGLEKHKKTHLENYQKSQIKCKECHKTFGSELTYQNHYKSIHLNEKRYQCKVCSKRFASASVLHIHKVSVCEKDKARKRTCPLCERTFDNYLLLYYHKQNSHKFGNTEDTVCHLCNKSFSKSVNLHSHNNQYHKWEGGNSRERSHLICDICGVQRMNGQFLFDHWLTHCKEKAFECPLCEIKFKQRCGFFQHKKIRHKNCKDIKIKTDKLMLQKLKQKFQIWEKSLQLASGPSSTDKQVKPELKNLNMKNYNSAPVKNYADFSRSNVPEESLKRQKPTPLSNTTTLDNGNDDFLSEATLDSGTVNNDITLSEKLLINENNLFNEAFPDLDYDYDFDDLNLNIEDVKPFNVNEIIFSEDPFPEKLIVKLEKLQEYTCLACNVVLYTDENYQEHTQSESHRSELKTYLEVGIVKEENISDEMEHVPETRSKRKKLNEQKPKLRKVSSVKKVLQCCLVCEDKFVSNQALKRHYISQHNGENILKCEFCKESFLQSNLLDAHMKYNHKDLVSEDVVQSEIVIQKKTFDCNICRETFTNPERYKSHELSHKYLKYKCVVCQSLFDTAIDLENHYSVAHKEEMPFQCEECTAGFPTKSRLDLHKENVHLLDSEEKRVKGEHSCKQCGKMFKIRKMLIIHMVRHDQRAERQFICEFCGRSFLIEGSLKTHRRSHTGEKPYSCDECEMNFVSSRKLRQHKCVVHLKRKHICEICGNSFTKNSKLTIHLRTHSGERPYPCKECEKSFISSSHLKNHVDQVHLGIRHMCDTCGKTFSDPRNLRKHRKRHDGIKSLCPHCAKEYATPSDLQRHIDVIHLKLHLTKRDAPPRNFTCPTCSEQFRTNFALTRHSELHNPNRPFACELCSYRFNFNSNLVLHRKNVHEKQGIDYWTKGRRARKAIRTGENYAQ